jgi:Flp pilus assembly pilin Flp
MYYKLDELKRQIEVRKAQGDGSMLLVHEQCGQGLVEYLLVLLVVFMLILVILTMLGGQVANSFSHVTNQLGTIP